MALILALVLVLLTASAAAAQDAQRVAMARVRLTTDPKVPVGCATLGTINDDSLKDLRRKVVRMGGDTALLSFPAENLERINAIVFRCPPASASAPPARPAPQLRDIPPPPAGTPPAPPPDASAPTSR